MSFTTEMTARFGSDKIVRWTNPDDKDASSINTTMLDAIFEDVKADFRTEAGVEYDSTDARMVKIACRGASIYLRQNNAEHGAFDSAHSKYIESLQALSKKTNQNRLVPALKEKTPLQTDYTNTLRQLNQYTDPYLDSPSFFPRY